MIMEEQLQPPSRVQLSPSAKIRGPAPAAPKLRDSCHACAASKLKCNKEKPTCARCARRRITCEYLATKRGGRKHANRNANTTDNSGTPPSTIEPPTSQDINKAQFVPPQAAWFTSPTGDPSTATHGSPVPIHVSSQLSSMAVDIHAATLSPVDHTMNTGLDALFATPSSFSIPDLSDSDILDPSHFFSASIDNGSNNITSSNSSEHLFENFPECGDIPDLSAFYKPGPTNADSHASPLDTQSSAMQGVEAQCFCLLRALSLMKHLFPSPNNNGSFASALYEVDQQQIHPGQQLQSNTPPNIQTVIAKNEQTIEAIHSMLQCSCSQDGYLLTIISLIVFKVLSWYEGAAAPKISSSLDDAISGIHTPNTTHSRKSSHSEMVIQDRPVVGNYHLEGADSDRMAAQLVLGELHRVQRLVNQLSGKLKVQEAQQVAFLGGETSSKNANGNFALPLSSVTLDQIITDLRKRLKALSGNIAESLRS